MKVKDKICACKMNSLWRRRIYLMIYILQLNLLLLTALLFYPIFICHHFPIPHLLDHLSLSLFSDHHPHHLFWVLYTHRKPLSSLRCISSLASIMQRLPKVLKYIFLHEDPKRTLFSYANSTGSIETLPRKFRLCKTLVKSHFADPFFAE